MGADLTGWSCRSTGRGATRAFTRAEEVFVALGDGEADPADREFMRRAGARAVLWHPVVRDRAAIGVLAIAWREAVERGLAAPLGDDRPARRRGGGGDRPRRPARPARAHGAHRRAHRAAQPPPLGAAAARASSRAPGATSSRSASRCSTSTTSRPTTTAAATRPATGCCARRRSPGGRRCARTTSSPATAARSSASSCPAARSPTRVDAGRAPARGTPEGESCSAGIAEWDGDEQAEAWSAAPTPRSTRPSAAGRDRVGRRRAGFVRPGGPAVRAPSRVSSLSP